MSTIYNKRQLASGISVIAIAAALGVATPAQAQSEYRHHPRARRWRARRNPGRRGRHAHRASARSARSTPGQLRDPGPSPVRLHGHRRGQGAANCTFRSARRSRSTSLASAPPADGAIVVTGRRTRSARSGADGRDQHHSCADRKSAAEPAQLPELRGACSGRAPCPTERRRSSSRRALSAPKRQRPARRHELQEPDQPRRHVRAEFRRVRKSVPADRHPGISGPDPELRRRDRSVRVGRADRDHQDGRRRVPRLGVHRVAAESVHHEAVISRTGPSRITTASSSAASSAARSSRAS